VSGRGPYTCICKCMVGLGGTGCRQEQLAIVGF